MTDHKTGLRSLKSEVSMASGIDVVPMYPSAQGINHKPRLGGPSTEAPDCYTSWIRDEPYNSCVPLLESSRAPAERSCKKGIGSSHGGADRASSSGGTASVLIDDRRTTELLAQLRATPVKEDVLHQCIERHGGGQAGLRAVVAAILFWVQMKNARNSLKSGDLSIGQAGSPSAHTDGPERISWQNLDTESIVDAVIGLSRKGTILKHASSLTGSVAGLAQSPSSGGGGDSSPCDLRAGDSRSGEYSQGSPYESQPPGMGEPEADGGRSGGLLSRGSGLQFWKDVSSDHWTSQVGDLGHEKADGAKVTRQKSSVSGDGNGGSCVSDLYGNDAALRQNSNILRQSRSTPEYTLPAQGLNDSQTYFNAAKTEALGIFCEANSLGHFSTSSSPFPTDPQYLDFSTFEAYGLRGPVFVNESMGPENAIHGCGLDGYGSLGRRINGKSSITGLGVSSSSCRKTSPAACTRLARKQRLDRNRRSTSQVNRGPFESIAHLADNSVAVSSPGLLRNSSRSPGTQASDGRARKTVDRRQQESLQFLLMKVLKPSDVGNLGRIVLPKKDAECHLPWLNAREGIPLSCEDYDTGERMVLRYRFWPNNKSRMYLLENTGNFIKRHHLQESDRLLVYRNPSNGFYVIRARKAQDCKIQEAMQSLPYMAGQSETLVEETEAEVRVITVQDSSEGPCSSGTSSQSVESAEVLSHEGVPGSRVVTSREDLLNFADLPDAPMGVTDQLVRFPSLESFDVELLESLPGKEEEDVTSCIVKTEAQGR